MISIPNGRGGEMDPSGRDINLGSGPVIPLNKAAKRADEARRKGKKVGTPKVFRGARY